MLDTEAISAAVQYFLHTDSPRGLIEATPPSLKLGQFFRNGFRGRLLRCVTAHSSTLPPKHPPERGDAITIHHRGRQWPTRSATPAITLRRLHPSPSRLDRSLRAFRLVASIDDDVATTQVQIHGWDTDTNAWQWMNLDTWTLAVTDTAPARSDDDLAADLTISALERGWDLEAETLRNSMPTPTAPVQIANHARVLATLAATPRPPDAALRNLLAELPPTGAPGHVPWSMVADMFGLERRHIASMRRRLDKASNR